VNRRSIRFRLTAWYAAILGITLAVVGIGVWLAIRNSINDTVDKELRSRLQAMRVFLQREASANGGSLHELIEDAAVAPTGTRFRIANLQGKWLYQSPGTESWGAAPADVSHLPKRGRIGTVDQNGKPTRVLSAIVPLGIVQIGIPIDEFAEMLDAFSWTAILASPLLLILASSGGYWMSRRAMAPVEQIAETAGEIGAQNLSRRLPLRGTEDELDHLSATLNSMFERLEDSFRRITQFTADASHELRTPISIIRTTTEVIRKRPRSEKEYAEALDKILAESERTTDLVERLMLLARADANTEEMVVEPVAFAELAHATCADASSMAETAGIKIRIDQLNPCTVSGDGAALRRLILILLDNAIKYSKPGNEVQVRLDICRCGTDAQAILKVQDSGIGISPQDLPHIFERFYRASKDRSRRVDGVGLGLSIAQLIAHRHGGEIQAESQLGGGSSFRVILPATELLDTLGRSSAIYS
jgi:heavy metal sensor kinase